MTRPLPPATTGSATGRSWSSRSCSTNRSISSAGSSPDAALHRGDRLGRSDDRRVSLILQMNLEASSMGIAPSTISPHRSVDATGRALPMTEEEIRARATEVARGLDALDNMGDEEE